MDFMGQKEILFRRGVGRKHDVFPGKTERVCHQKLGIGRTVHAAAFFLKDFQQKRIGSGFDGEIFSIAFVPGKGFFQRPGVFPDSLFVIDMKRGGILPANFVDLLQRDEWGLFHILCSFPSTNIYASPSF